MTQEELSYIINDCIKGNSKSQEKIFKLYYNSMLIVCMRYAKHEDEAKDILQDGFIKVFNNIHKYDFSGSFNAWVKRIMINTSIDSYRKNKKLIALEDENNINEDLIIEKEEESMYEGINGKDILNAMNKLSPKYRAVFNLFAIENYTHKEISEILGISEGTSKSNYAKAKKRLRDILKDKLEHIRNI